MAVDTTVMIEKKIVIIANRLAAPSSEPSTTHQTASNSAGK